MATGGLYGQSTAGIVSPQSGSESVGLYGNNTVFGGTYFEWFIFKEAITQPSTPTGGSWSFGTNTGTPPTGWTLQPPAAPVNQVWVSIALVNSKTTSALTWSTPGLFGVVPQFTFPTPVTGAPGTNAAVVNSGTATNPILTFTIPRGDTGATGTAATIAAGTTTTTNPGTSATVTNVGTSAAAVFNFGIPRGAGVNSGGSIGQVLTKASGTDYDTTWTTIIGTLNYQGSWNASTNTPTLTSSVGTNGYYYVVGTAGSTNLNGITDWQVGDWAIFNGSIWQKLDQTNLVTSVAGKTGAVTLVYSDIIGTVPTWNQNTTGTAANVTGIVAVANGGTGASTAATALTNLGAYPASNPSGYTNNTGTVTAVAGTGTVNGLTLTGTVTTSGNLILGGTLNLSSPPAIGGTAPAGGAFTTLTASSDPSFTSTGAVQLPSGTTAQQPTGVAGKLRFNTTTSQFEGYNGATWASVGGAAITNDTATATYEYPLFASATSGTALTVYTSNAKYLYKPSTGELQASLLNATNGIVINNQTISTSVTIPAGSSAMSSGPITIASGQSVTVSSGSRWVII